MLLLLLSLLQVCSVVERWVQIFQHRPETDSTTHVDKTSTRPCQHLLFQNLALALTARGFPSKRC